MCLVSENKVTSLINGKYGKLLDIHKYNNRNREAEFNSDIYIIGGERIETFFRKNKININLMR